MCASNQRAAVCANAAQRRLTLSFKLQNFSSLLMADRLGTACHAFERPCMQIYNAKL